MYVLVDTPIWSLALRKKGITKEDEFTISILQELIEESRVKIIGPIRQEILSGISLKASFDLLKNKLEVFEDTLISSEDYVRAAEMFSICRKNGVQGSHIDFLICAICERDHFSILTLDKDFQLYARYLPILLFNSDKS